VDAPERQFVVREPCDVEIVLRSDRRLVPGDTVEAQFPNSWLLVSGPSFTRELQADDPDAAHFVRVHSPGGAARFDVEIRRRNLAYPEGTCRHGRHVIATLAEGAVEAGAPIRVLYANTFAPYTSGTEPVWLRVCGEAPDCEPRLAVAPGPAETVRILAPSGVEPGQEFDVVIASLDRFQNASSTSYQGQTLSLDGGAVVVGLIGVLLWYGSIGRTTASGTAVYQYLVPGVSCIGAALFMGERLAPMQIIGISVMLAGVYLARVPDRTDRQALNGEGG